MAQSLSSLQKSECLKLIILIFHEKNLNNQCELDVRVIPCNFQVFGIFSVFSNFFRSNSFIFEPKVEKIYMGVFPLNLCHFKCGCCIVGDQISPFLTEKGALQLILTFFHEFLHFSRIFSRNSSFLWCASRICRLRCASAQIRALTTKMTANGENS